MRWDKAVSVLGIGLLAVGNNQHENEEIRQGSFCLPALNTLFVPLSRQSIEPLQVAAFIHTSNCFQKAFYVQVMFSNIGCLMHQLWESRIYWQMSSGSQKQLRKLKVRWRRHTARGKRKVKKKNWMKLTNTSSSFSQNIWQTMQSRSSMYGDLQAPRRNRGRWGKHISV